MTNGASWDHEKRYHEKTEHRNGVLFKEPNDDRITRFGGFLRKSSLDELPQLWNVLSGDMSLVGPRPHMALELADLSARELRRLNVKPGITGLWQVNGRSELAWEEAVKLDLLYVSNQSLWLDLTILLRTIPAVIAARGAF
jgi:lipopolysaccharide/colanic/teichoic acid biosynthesis glycosyltransferase